jgi:2'-5' RNA ligase
VRDGKRLFVGARISVAASNALAGCAETLARRARDAGIGLRWVAPVNYHVTLAFLGWTGVDAIGAVCDALAKATATAGAERIGFRTARLGAFASLDRASVLWAGIEDGGALGRLAQSIDEAVAVLGFPRDPRGFHPHVTIARLREPRAIRDTVLPMAEQMFGDTKLDAIALFESETKSNGSVYHVLEKIGLPPARNAPPSGRQRQTVALERGAPDREPERIDGSDETDDGWPRGQGPTQ